MGRLFHNVFNVLANPAQAGFVIWRGIGIMRGFRSWPALFG